MPLTAYSTSREREGDVEQILKQMSAQFEEPYNAADGIPEDWRAYLRSDLQCPSCFVTGAEVVRGAGRPGAWLWMAHHFDTQPLFGVFSKLHSVKMKPFR